MVFLVKSFFGLESKRSLECFLKRGWTKTWGLGECSQVFVP
jgi:hypothetical protein